MIHIRKTGHNIDRRMRMARKRHTNASGTFCGATASEGDLSRENAAGCIRLAALAHLPGGSKRAAEDAANLCPDCVKLMNG